VQKHSVQCSNQYISRPKLIYAAEIFDMDTSMLHITGEYSLRINAPRLKKLSLF